MKEKKIINKKFLLILILLSHTHKEINAHTAYLILLFIIVIY